MPRLVTWREEVAATKRASFAGEQYWGRPVPGFGDPGARLVVVGLAPAAHGANRTGRVFTGDRSGDWLYGALFRAGYANQPNSRSRDDGLELRDAYVTAAVRCAPPANKPTVDERDTCVPFLAEELGLLGDAAVIVVLGSSPSAWSPHSRGSGPGRGSPTSPSTPWPTVVCSSAPTTQASRTPSPAR